jgi:hypothetical protein
MSEGEQGLGVESGASEPGSRITDEMPPARGEVRYPDEENPEGPPRTPKEGHVDPDADDVTDAAPGAKD